SRDETRFTRYHPGAGPPRRTRGGPARIGRPSVAHREALPGSDDPRLPTHAPPTAVYLSSMTFSRDDAWELMCSWTSSPALRAHMRAVELAMRHFAPRYGGDPEWWGTVGLLHDFDYERFPNIDRAADREHPTEGVN